jgi:hypothetical protein
MCSESQGFVTTIASPLKMPEVAGKFEQKLHCSCADIFATCQSAYVKKQAMMLAEHLAHYHKVGCTHGIQSISSLLAKQSA